MKLKKNCTKVGYPNNITYKFLTIFVNFLEESSKRSSAHGQFAYNYDKTETLAIESVEEPKDEEPDEVFVPHPNFYVPPDIPVVC